MQNIEQSSTAAHRRGRSGAARVLGVTALTGALVLGGAGVANAHGWVGAEGSDLIARQAMPGNTGLGNAQYDKQSLEGAKGFPEAGPADGHLASVNEKFGPELDEQSPTRWVKNEVQAGPVHVNWTFTAAHKTTDWKYFITKNGWDQNAPLTRAELEPLATVEHDGSEASNHPNQVINIPADHHGYHVIYAVWDVADTANAFYNTIDVDIEGSAAPDTQAPSVPKNLSASTVTPSSASLRWGASTDDTGVASYRVYRDGKKLADVSAPEFTDTALSPERTYTYRVDAIDAAGNASPQSAPLTVATPPLPDTDAQAPTAPTGLHSMGVTPTAVDLMWAAATDDFGVDHYRITRMHDGANATFTTADTMFTDATVAAGQDYSYTVAAVDAAGNTSASSNTLTVTTPDNGNGGDCAYPEWDPFASYKAGDTVTHNGTRYIAVQSYAGHGDPNWIDALSLWKPIQ